MKRGTERSMSILARNTSKMNPLYPGRRIAANAGYKVGAVRETRRTAAFARAARAPTPALPRKCGGGLGWGRRRGWLRLISHRHLAVPHRGAGGEAFGGVDDGVGVHAMVAIEVVDGAGLAEMLDAEGFDLVAAHTAEPAQCRRMAVDHGDDTAIARQRGQQLFDMAEMLGSAAIAAPGARRGPARMQPVRRCECQEADIPAGFTGQAG